VSDRTLYRVVPPEDVVPIQVDVVVAHEVSVCESRVVRCWVHRRVELQIGHLFRLLLAHNTKDEQTKKQAECLINHFNNY